MGSEFSTLLQNGDLVLDRYRVVDALATGGHSVVYMGHDERLARPVCIKIFASEEADAGVGRTSYEHFVQEAFALSKLTHPSTLRIYDFGHLPGASAAEPGPPVQICEYMNGGTLSQMVHDHGSPPLPQAITMLTAMCAALAEAHALGIIHRDIKPQNILFANVGNERLAKLADFGIAKWSNDGEALDQGQRADDTQIVAGRRLAMYSPSWAAPEQIDGRPASAATDVFSLAAVGVYLLTGEVIFSEEEVFAGYKKRRSAAELVRNALAQARARGAVLPEALWPVLCKALAFDSADRYQRIADFSAGLMKASLIVVTKAPVQPAADAHRAVPPAMSGSFSPMTLPPPMGTAAAAGAQPLPLQPVEGAKSPAQFDRAQLATVVTSNAEQVRIALVEEQTVLERQVMLVFAPDGVADLLCPGPAKLRVTILPAAQRVVHLKSMSSFIAPVGGRPSSAMQLERDAGFDFISPNHKMLARARFNFGYSQGAIAVLPLGGRAVIFDKVDCGDPICVDFGPGATSYIVYTQGRPLPPVPKPRRG